MVKGRSYIRYSVKGSVNFKSESGTVIVSDGILVNISFMGLCLETKERIEIGTIVQFEVSTDLLDKILVGKAVVRNVEEVKTGGNRMFRVGVEFLSINEDDILYLLSNIQHKICRARRKAAKSGTPKIKKINNKCRL